MPDEKPNPKVFARHVLWHLAGIQARLKEIETRLAFQAARGDQALADRIISESAARQLEVQKDLFADAVKRAGVDESESGTPPAPKV